MVDHINSKQRPAVLAVCAKWGLSVFCFVVVVVLCVCVCVCVWSPLSSIYLHVFLSSFFSSSFFLFLGDGLILDGNSQRAVNTKTTNLPAIQGN